MRYYLLFLVTFLVACGGSDFLPEADILGPDAAVSDLSDSDTDLLRRDNPAEDRGQPDEGGDEGVELVSDEGQDVTDAQEDDVGEDVPAADTSVEDPGADEGEDAQEDVPEDVGGDEGSDLSGGHPCSWIFDCWRQSACPAEEWAECLREECFVPLSDEAAATYEAIEDCVAEYCKKHPVVHCDSDAWSLDCRPYVQACLDDVD